MTFTPSKSRCIVTAACGPEIYLMMVKVNKLSCVTLNSHMSDDMGHIQEQPPGADAKYHE